MSDKESKQTIIEEYTEWLQNQIDIAREERRHAQDYGYDANNILLYNLISTKIIAYETVKDYLWQIEALRKPDIEIKGKLNEENKQP